MSHAAADIIQRFPGPIVLSPTPQKGVWWLLTLGSGAMATVSVIVILAALTNWQLRPALGFGILGLLFFGTGVIVGTVLLRPNSGSLSLSADGFEVTYLYRKRFYYWEQVNDFAIYSSKGRENIVFRTAKPYFGFLDRLNAGLTGGRNGWLPDTYGYEASDLASLLIAWQDRTTETKR